MKVKMSRKCYTAALEASDWSKENGNPEVTFSRVGRGSTANFDLTPEQLDSLIYHVTVLRDSLAGEWDTAEDVRAMNVWLARWQGHGHE